MTEHEGTMIWGFLKIRGNNLVAPVIRSIVFWGLYRGPPILGNYYLHWILVGPNLMIPRASTFNS